MVMAPDPETSLRTPVELRLLRIPSRAFRRPGDLAGDPRLCGPASRRVCLDPSRLSYFANGRPWCDFLAGPAFNPGEVNAGPGSVREDYLAPPSQRMTSAQLPPLPRPRRLTVFVSPGSMAAEISTERVSPSLKPVTLNR